MRYESGSKIIGHADHARQQRKMWMRTLNKNT